MRSLFENSDTLHRPVECFMFDAAKESFPVRPHWHYFTEMIYMRAGSCEMYANGKQYILQEGDMILFHPNVIHSIYALNENPLRYAVLKFDIGRWNLSAGYAPKFRNIFKSAEKQEMPVFFSKQTVEEIGAAHYFADCIREAETKDYAFDVVVKAQIYHLLVEIIRLWNKNGFTVGSEAFTEDNRYGMDNVTEYIDANMNHPIKVSDIASQCGMSYSYFAKQFLHVYGKTCKEYIESMRLQKAEEFLLFTDFDLNYISQETGFSDCSHLIKSFKKAKQITPKQFRTEYRKKEKRVALPKKM